MSGAAETMLFLVGATGLSILFVTWVLYPVAVGTLATLRLGKGPSHRPAASKPTDRVSVILATRSGFSEVRRRITDILRTSYPRDMLEVVVALDLGAAWTPEQINELSRLDNVRIVQSAPPGGKAAALNAGVSAAEGDTLVFTDTRQRFDRETIPALVAVFSDETVAGASGSLVLRARENGASPVDLYWRFERWLRRCEARVHSPVGVTGAVCAFRSSVWRPLPAGVILDDVYTPMRVVLEGHRVAFVDDAVAYETRRPTPAHEFRRKVRTLTGNVQLCAWLPALLVPWKNPLFVPFVFHKLLRLLTPWAAASVVVGLVGLLAIRYPNVFLLLAAVLGVGLLWVFMTPSLLGRRLRRIGWELWLTQAAAVQATVNGLRGRWDVWE